ncbi:NAD(P)/FAD-dependent oxidoreductase [Natrialbaceae archaeon GCM10025810]|uniref:NAD(P)/FAD-dependent oxidoreductase n=1 Tax=Halovalidus salilacus TaxID=3075124 RepID=UPI0036182347
MTLASIPRYDGDRVGDRRGRAVVVGASIAGMLSARVLADAFEEVTVLDRDSLPDEPAPRRGVPQGNHPHSLWESGRATIEDLLPGFSEDLRGAGSVTSELGADFKIYLQGDFLAPGTERHVMYFATRSLFEHLIRRRFLEDERIRLRPRCRLVEYLVDDDESAVTGAMIRNQEHEREVLEADLVVDATGRTSRTPAWLDAHGYESPTLDEIRIDLGYGSTFLDRPPDDARAFAVDAEAPNTRGAFVFPVEGDRWIFNLNGVHGDRPPTDVEGYAAFAANLPIPDVSELFDEHSTGSEEIVSYPFPSNRRYRYEDLERFPGGLLVVGDAIASYNPTNGQGISVAALQAVTLHHALASGDRADLARRFFDRAGAVVDVAWDLTVGGDLAFPQTEGPRPRGTTAFNWYLDRMLRRAHTDGRVADAAFRVFSLQRPPSDLFRPRVVWRVLGPAPFAREARPRKPPRRRAA